MKVHVKLKGKPLCGARKQKRKLRFVEGPKEFKDLAAAEQCGNCKRAIAS